MRFPCPCCGHLVFDDPPGSYEICPVCIWEDDLVQLRYTAPKPDGAYGPGHQNISLFNDNGHGGMIVLDVVHSPIMFVEVLYYPPLTRDGQE